MGVTCSDPETMTFPPIAIDLRGGSWIMSGNNIMKDGRSININRVDLDKVDEGDEIGVMRTSEGELIFFVNGISHGVAATNLPNKVFAVVDLYGKVVQVTITKPPLPATVESPSRLDVQQETQQRELRLDEEDEEDEVEEGGGEEGEMQSTVTDLVASLDVGMTVGGRGVGGGVGGTGANEVNRAGERLRFHACTGTLVKLSYNARTAERLRPMDEFNNGVVMTHRPLQDNQLFEIRIDRLVEKWSGSIEVGVTTHNPSALEFPATMTNMRSGTTMMSGCGILTNGKGIRREYGEFNLDELRVGDRIGMMRKANNNLHFFINGLDQGVAARVPPMVWGVVDLYGMTVKVTIVDRDEREEQNLITRRNTALRDQHISQSLNGNSTFFVMYFINCVIINYISVILQCAMDDFNNGVVLTHRPLKTDELFEIRLDKMVTKWAGSIEIGVTTHAPTELEFPSTMTNVRSGTWMMTGNGVMHNGTTIIDEYGQNLDRLQVGDRVGVIVRNNGGSLHFLVNGVDQGEAATNIHPRVYGVIDLYGQAAQATILDYNCHCCYSPSADTSAAAAAHALHSSAVSAASRVHTHGDLHFHHIHGRNARVSNNGRTASRPRALGEFSDAIVMSNRPLRDDEMFAVVIEKIVDRWSDSIEAGVTAIRPDELELPGTMTDLDHDTWMLSGSAVMKDGMTLKHSYALDLDTLTTGSVIGMKRHQDGSLHYYLDGVDQGEACSDLPTNIYPVIDLYGQCAQVSIVSPTERPAEPDSNDNSCSHGLAVGVASRIEEPIAALAPPTMASSLQQQQQPSATFILHRLSPWCGKNVTLLPGCVAASRGGPGGAGANHGLVQSASLLVGGELFEVAVDRYAPHWAGSLAIGLTLSTPADNNPLPQTIAGFKIDTWYVQGGDVYQNGHVMKSNYCRSLDWLRVGGRVGVRRCNDATLHLYINGCDQGIAAHNIPKKVYAVVDLYGSVCGIKVTSRLLTAPSATLKDAAGAAAAAAQVPVALALEEDLSSKREEAAAWSDLPKDEDSERKKMSPLEVDSLNDDLDMDDDFMTHMSSIDFHESHGRNVQLSENRVTARRIASYNQGLLLTRSHLPRGQLFQIRVEGINSRWVSSLCIGVTTHCPETSSSLPVTVLGLKRDSWVICSDCVFHNGQKIKCKYGTNLDTVGAGHLIGIMIDVDCQLRLFVDNVDQGVAATGITLPCRVVIDLYGQCEQVSIIGPQNDSSNVLAAANEVPAVLRKSTLDSIENELRMSTDNQEDEDDGNELVAQEKADLESHEKESPVDISSRDDPMRAKSDKTNENIQMEMMTSASAAAAASSLPRATAAGDSGDDDDDDAELDPKSIASNENLSLQQQQQQQQNSKQMSDTNCDHKTGLNRANTSFVKSPSGGAIANKQSLEPLSLSSTHLATPTPSPPLTSSLKAAAYHCDYFNACLRLKSTIGLPGELGLGQNVQRKLHSKQDDCDASQLVFSPSIQHITNAKHQYIDPKTQKQMVALAAFQVLLRPGSYKVTAGGGASGGSAPPEATEWVTKERNATVLTALLLKIVPA
ncbi:hypothetical protein LSTR_LSTR006889 [Laodelphax striatellus]|uniref:NHR domain-containing protein n=1 Tax=Laodelphax striatellus TaxID=195883 RepID=A0A482XFT4_LAOST|nr:hypothetical protein LSTR_LSTR006889 [Laodelphax striatellus]